MATNTTKLGLVKPDLKDVADITVINNNMDLIDQFATNTDAAINRVSSSLSEHAGQHAVGGSDPLTLSMLGVNATAEELNYVDGVTSNIQMQLDNKDALGAANTALNNAKAHTNEVAQTTLTDAKKYTDETASAMLNDAKEYADGVSNTALSGAKQYTDDSITGLINGAPTTLDTLKEIADAMAENEDVVAALDQAIGNKADIGHTHTHEELEIESVVATDANNDGNVVLMGYASDEAEAHIGDKNNPHNVTIAQIGAAPSGYGLGQTAKEILDANAAVNNGWYKLTSVNAANAHIPFQYVAIHVTAYSDKYVIQDLYRTNGQNAHMRREMYNGTWGEWEYENPPMLLGVEYRTTKRYDGHVVYTQMISCGKGPASDGANYYLNLSTYDVIFTSIRCKAVSPTSYWGVFLDHYISFGEYGSGAPCVSLSADAGNQSNRDIYLIVEYYKV